MKKKLDLINESLEKINNEIKELEIKTNQDDRDTFDKAAEKLEAEIKQ